MASRKGREATRGRMVYIPDPLLEKVKEAVEQYYELKQEEEKAIQQERNRRMASIVDRVELSVA